MKKCLKIIGVVVVLLLVSALAIGLAVSPAFEHRSEHVIDAPIGKVWDVVSNPKLVKDWMPVHDEDERIVELKEPGALETLAKAGEQAAKTGDVDVKKLRRHTYVMKDGATVLVEVEQAEKNKVYMEHVVQATSRMNAFFHDMHWGFALEEVAGGKTKLTPIMRGTAARPHGTLMNKIGTWFGMHEKAQGEMAKNIELLAKK